MALFPIFMPQFYTRGDGPVSIPSLILTVLLPMIMLLPVTFTASILVFGNGHEFIKARYGGDSMGHKFVTGYMFAYIYSLFFLQGLLYVDAVVGSMKSASAIAEFWAAITAVKEREKAERERAKLFEEAELAAKKQL